MKREASSLKFNLLWEGSQVGKGGLPPLIVMQPSCFYQRGKPRFPTCDPSPSFSKNKVRP
jgi:hypothetical protein